MVTKTRQMTDFTVRVVNNGFILYDTVINQNTSTSGTEYVFETFDNLVKFLDSCLAEPGDRNV